MTKETRRISRVIAFTWAAFIAFMLVLFTASDTKAALEERIYVDYRADSTIRAGYDTATTENAFCAVVRYKEDGVPWVLGALQAQVSRRSALGVSFHCPPTMATVHWHLDGIPNTLPGIPSTNDENAARCYQPVPDFHERAPFHLIYWKGRYILYGVRESFPPHYEEDYCGSH